MANVESVLESERNWVELPCDITRMIMMKLDIFDMVESVQFVCKLWYDMCKDPSLWRTIHIQYSDDEGKEGVLFNIVDRSARGLIDFSFEGVCSHEFFSYVASRNSQLKRLRLACCDDISDNAMTEGLRKLSSLEELELTLCSLEDEKLVPMIESFPSLKTFKFNKLGSQNPYRASNVEALAIAENMLELQHLQLIGNRMTNEGLTAILDRCVHLESLDLRACFHLELVGNLGKRLSEQIKDLRLPYDSTHDYGYDTRADDSRCSYFDFFDTIEDDYYYEPEPEPDYLTRLHHRDRYFGI